MNTICSILRLTFMSAISISFMSSTFVIDTNKSVGTITGLANVCETGAATYTIPIECPAGINGLQPNVSLVYNSQSGRGSAGWKWNLSATSAVTRTGANFYYDGINREITCTNSDNLALDGHRLILTSGTNFGTNATYHTQTSFVKVTTI